MERDIFDSSRVLTAAHRRAVCTVLTATLSVVLGRGCIDVNVIQANARSGDGGPRDSQKSNQGESCAADDDCLIRLSCVEGVCCDSACASGCQTCIAPGAFGRCVARPAGTSPRDASYCPTATPASCGLDGECDGSGSCRYYSGNLCGGTCNGDSVVDSRFCDGTGSCAPTLTLTLCAPYTCDTSSGSCFQSCLFQNQCADGATCISLNGATATCGQALIGGHCLSGSDCSSGFCVDGVCCNVACQGGCAACNLLGRTGTCSPIDAGKPDPHGICVDRGASSCGQNGTCDGLGGCATYGPDTQCLAPSCAGNRLNTAGSCDGLGTCRAGDVLDCDPFRCVDGACIPSCQTDDDCATGSACVNGSCGPEGLGLRCHTGSECASGICADGVCCDSACDGPCQSCTLPASPGRCTTAPANIPDPHGFCANRGAASCGTNGKCDGSGGCAVYAPGTVCANETCAGGAYTPPSSCNAEGQCVAPDPLPCFPFACNGTRCFTNCLDDTQCAQAAVCGLNSCGLKRNGASCSQNLTPECESGNCAQGVCCDTACTGPCQSCALSGSLGTCTNVPPHVVDPAGTCGDQGASSCGTDGRCDGNGACEKYLPGTICVGQSCPLGSDLFTAARTCDGSGTCLPSSSASCAPYQCGANVCQNACTSDADCVAPATCNSRQLCGTPTQAMSSRR